VPLLAAYSTSKAAVVGLAEALRPEAAPPAVTPMTVACPGPVETPLLDAPSRTAGTEVRRHLVRSAGPPLAPEKVAGRASLLAR
jgi:NAD(P)-dependent dehydrogenase (short-subunit alcohol dehydrogenase family)